MKYQFTNKIPYNVCKNCGATFTKDWSSGGVGGICEDCYDFREQIDLVEMGIIKNISKVILPKLNEDSEPYQSFEFHAKIDNDWYKCKYPCGNWSRIVGFLESHEMYSVPVGYRELKHLYEKHYEGR